MGELWLALLSIDLVHDELSKMKNETANSTATATCNGATMELPLEAKLGLQGGEGGAEGEEDRANFSLSTERYVTALSTDLNLMLRKRR